MKKKKKLVIIKVGGQIVEESETLQQLLVNFSKIPGYKLLVHGGGRTATRISKQLGLESQMIEGKRVTDFATLQVITMVYAGVNKQIVAGLQALGLNALGLTGADLNCILSEKRPVKEVDYGFVGDIQAVDSDLLADLIRKGIVPVLAPLTHDGKGSMLNTNADTIAGEVAKALAKHFEVTLVYCFEKNGVLFNEKDDDSVIPVITKLAFEAFVSDGTVKEGMIPKLENAFNAIEGGVREVIITKAEKIEDLNCGTRVIKV